MALVQWCSGYVSFLQYAAGNPAGGLRPFSVLPLPLGTLVITILA